MGMDNEEHEPKFYGSTSVGSKGQIVIPSELREDVEIEPGDKLLFLRRSGSEKGFGVIKPEALFEMEEKIKKLRKKVEEKEE